MTTSDHAMRVWAHTIAIRQSAPLIHNITNLVVQNDTADAIAAVGATQMTLHTAEEAQAAASIAGALAVNAGTLDAAWLDCAHEAIRIARDRGIPWVLDPVAAGLSHFRTQAALQLLQSGPTVLKANASEILALAGVAASDRAADSIHSVEQAADCAIDMAREHHCVVVVTGAEDLVTDGRQSVRLGNGRPLMGRMIGSGCMLTSVIACFLAVADDTLDAAQAATGCFSVAGEIAAVQAGGPGTLKPLLLDALFNLDASMLRERLCITSGAKSPAPDSR